MKISSSLNKEVTFKFWKLSWSGSWNFKNTFFTSLGWYNSTILMINQSSLRILTRFLWMGCLTSKQTVQFWCWSRSRFLDPGIFTTAVAWILQNPLPWWRLWALQVILVFVFKLHTCCLYTSLMLFVELRETFTNKFNFSPFNAVSCFCSWFCVHDTYDNIIYHFIEAISVAAVWHVLE